MEPLVYIILVNYNGAQDTLDCIASLENINYKNFKIIVVDNCSSDNSVEVLKSNLKQKYFFIQSEKNEGFSAGNNLGINIAMDNNADYILLLNNDTIVEANFLKELVSSTTENTGIIIGKIYYESERNKIWYDGGKINFSTGRVIHCNYDKVDIKDNDNERKVTFATGCCMLISRDAIKRIGILEEKYFLYYEDTDYCCKVMKYGLDIVYNPKSIIYHKVSSSTGKNSKLSQYYLIRNRMIFIKDNIEKKFKLIAYIYFYAQLLVDILRGKVSISIARRGIKDYMKNIDGKVVL